MFESTYLLAVLADDRPSHVLAYTLQNCTGTGALLGYIKYVLQSGILKASIMQLAADLAQARSPGFDSWQLLAFHFPLFPN